MGLRWQIWPDDRIVMATVEDTLIDRDLAAWFDDVLVKGGISYGKLIDARQGRSGLSSADVMANWGRIEGMRSLAPLGPLAIVAGNDQSEAYGDFFRALGAVAGRSMRIFTGPDEARRWLVSELESQSSPA